MKILFDTNIIIDFLTAREPFSKDAKKVVALVETRDVEGYISASSVTTIHYLSSKVFDEKKADEIIKELLDIFEVTFIDKTTFLEAIKSKGSDFEDSVISQSAKQNSIDIIISRDKTGFKNSPVLTMEPDKFLASMSL